MTIATKGIHPHSGNLYGRLELMNQQMDNSGSGTPLSTETSNFPIENLESILLLVHSLSNKLLPIVVCSELALRRCGEDQVRPLLEKIQRAANEARDIIAQMRQSSDENVIGDSDGSSGS